MASTVGQKRKLEDLGNADSSKRVKEEEASLPSKSAAPVEAEKKSNGDAGGATNADSKQAVADEPMPQAAAQQANVKNEHAEDKAAKSEPPATAPKKAGKAKEPASSSSDSSDSDSDSDSDDDEPLSKRYAVTPAESKAKPKPKAQAAAARKPKAKPKAKAKSQKDESSSSEDSDDSSDASSDDSSDDSSSSDESSSSSSSESSDSSAPRRKRKRSSSRRSTGGVEVHDPAKYEVREDIKPMVSTSGPNKWWARDLDFNSEIKWKTLEHNGVLFPPPYEPHGVKMLYDGEPVELTPEQEEVATWYAVMLDTDHVQKKQFRKNFFEDWSVLLGPNHKIQKLELCDFKPIATWALAERERKKEEKKKPENRAKTKAENALLAETYGWALVDGYRERVANFKVEIPGLFRGRGQHPKTGKIKKRIMPEDVTLNISRGAPIPKSPIPGHQWKGVVHNPRVTWLAFYKDNINGNFKYIFLHANSKFKGVADFLKYEKARKLKDHIGSIRKDYRAKLSSKSTTERQLATAVYFIDVLALRVGNEKNTDEEADTVGCCSLRVEHVKLKGNNQLELDFLGKDSMRYHNTVTVTELVYNNIKAFCVGKSASDTIFHRISTSAINQYFKDKMDGLTAKVFRTYNASVTLEKELYKEDAVDRDDDVNSKVLFYNRANREVAILCNHQRTIPKSHAGAMEKLEKQLQETREYITEMEEYLEKLESKKKKKKLPTEDSRGKKLSTSVQVIRRRIASLHSKVENLITKQALKENNKTVSLTTAKINYMDPRISVAWCKATETPIEKVFQRAMAIKFPWAMEVDPKWRF